LPKNITHTTEIAVTAPDEPLVFDEESYHRLQPLLSFKGFQRAELLLSVKSAVSPSPNRPLVRMNRGGLFVDKPTRTGLDACSIVKK
jgi:hypothetical protein